MFEVIPPFLLYLLSGMAIVALGLLIQLWVTPFAEIALVRQGNMAAAAVFSGHLLGLTLPVASTMAHAVSLLDMLSWGAAATLIQVLTHMGVRFLVRDFVAHIQAARTSVGVLSAVVCLAAGVLNAAALTY